MSHFISRPLRASGTLLLVACIHAAGLSRVDGEPVESAWGFCAGEAAVLAQEEAARDGYWATFSVPKRNDGYWVPEFVRNVSIGPVGEAASFPPSSDPVSNQADGFAVPEGILPAGSSTADRVTIRLWVTNRSDGYWFPRFVKNTTGSSGTVSAVPGPRSPETPVMANQASNAPGPRSFTSAPPASNRLRQGRSSNQARVTTVVIAKGSGSEPALAVGAVPALMFERRKVVAPALARQMRLDVDQGIEKLGPELNPVPLAHSGAGASILGAGPVLSGVEETVAKLESAARAGAGTVSGVPAGDSARRADEVRIIPDDTKRREQFRVVSSFFDPPTIKSSPPAAPATSSATYEQR